MLKIIDKYLLKELIGPFVFGVATFSFILAGGTVIFPLISEALKYQIPFLKVIQLFIFKLPFIIVWTFPMATLFTALIVFGRLNSDLEILAFRAGGINFTRIVTPVIVVGFFISLLTILMNEAIVPQTNNSVENLFRSYRNQTKPTIKQNINFTELKNGQLARIINVQNITEGI